METHNGMYTTTTLFSGNEGNYNGEKAQAELYWALKAIDKALDGRKFIASRSHAWEFEGFAGDSAEDLAWYATHEENCDDIQLQNVGKTLRMDGLEDGKRVASWEIRAIKNDAAVPGNLDECELEELEKIYKEHGEDIDVPGRKNPFERPTLAFKAEQAKEAANGFKVVVGNYGYSAEGQLREVTLTDTGFIIDSGAAPDMDKFSREDFIDMYGDEPEIKVSLDSNVKEWYMEKFPTDELGADISESLTFDDAFSALENGNDIYDALGVGDSVVRERLFDGLSEATGKSYGEVYNVWLKGTEKAEGVNSLDAARETAQDASDRLSETRGNVDAPSIDPR